MVKKMKLLIILQTICLLVWVIWIVGFPIYKKIKKENMLYDGTMINYISVMWIFAIIFNVFNLLMRFIK